VSPATTHWTLEPHSEGKHEVLRHYLRAWFPILGSTQSRILFIDGFAGPGRYLGGQEGSPLIALKVLRDHSTRFKADVKFSFIEKDVKRAACLREVIDDLKPTFPASCSVDVVPGAFDETMTGLLDELDAQGRRLAPAFVMVDPFGVSGTPMAVLERILRGEKTEVYVSFMYEAINRFKATTEFEKPLTELFGTEEWREGLELQGEAKKDFYYGLYEKQLRRAGATNVLHFELFEGNRLVYAIFFATRHWLGADRMKQAIWKVAPFGDFAFRGTRSRQLTLGLEMVDYTSLRQTLQEYFRPKGWVTVDEIIEFVGSDQTDLHSSQLKTPVLVPMEDENLIEVDSKSRKRRHTFPNGTRLRFL